MTDILIKGMEMPKDEYVDVRIFKDGSVIANQADANDPNSHYATFNAIAVPPHGRLIDADKLLPESGYDPMMFQPKYGGDHRTQYNTLMGYEIFYMVDEAPTVLEAST